MRFAKFAFLVVALLLSVPVLADTPVVDFGSQAPADIDAFNLMGLPVLNIIYNVTSSDPINTSAIRLYFKTNYPGVDHLNFVNGTASATGFANMTYYSNLTSNFTFRLYDYEVYPATYNLNEGVLEQATHQNRSLGLQNNYLKIRLFNVSNTKNFSFFEFMAFNTSTTTTSLSVYYCNSSYTTGSPITSTFCTNFFNLAPTSPYNHSHSDYSSHHVAPFPIDLATGRVGNVYVTPTSYFLLRGTNPVRWSAGYVATVARPDTIKTSTNNGNSWANFAGTVDAHLHQYDGTDTFYYYACANDTNNDEGCSSPLREDLIQEVGLPPTSPQAFAPATGFYRGNVQISYTAAVSPNAYSIDSYNISLMNPDQTFNSTIIGDNSPNLDYLWDSTLVPDGQYYVKVEACDSLGQCSFGLSENLTVDNTKPSIALNYPSAGLLTYLNTLPFKWTATDGLSPSMQCNLTLNSTVTATNVASTNNVLKTYSAPTLAKGTWFWNVTCLDAAGNENTSETRNFTIGSAPSGPAYQNGASIVSTSNKTTTEVPSNLTDIYGDTVYSIDLTGFTQTALWAAMYGNVSGNIVLSSNDSSDVHTLFSWAVDPLGTSHYLISYAPLNTSGINFDSDVGYYDSFDGDEYVITADNTDLYPGVTGNDNVDVVLFYAPLMGDGNFTWYFNESITGNFKSCAWWVTNVCDVFFGGCTCYNFSRAFVANGAGRDYTWNLTTASDPTVIPGNTDPAFLKVNRTEFGAVYAYAASSTPYWAGIQATPWTGEQLDDYLGFDAGWSDNANRTFIYANPAFTIGQQVIAAGSPNTAAKSENGANSSVWETVALNDTGAMPLFVSPLKRHETAYNSEFANYQMLLPNNQKLDGPATEYYFYLELH